MTLYDLLLLHHMGIFKDLLLVQCLLMLQKFHVVLGQLLGRLLLQDLVLLLDLLLFLPLIILLIVIAIEHLVVFYVIHYFSFVCLIEPPRRPAA